MGYEAVGVGVGGIRYQPSRGLKKREWEVGGSAGVFKSCVCPPLHADEKCGGREGASCNCTLDDAAERVVVFYLLFFLHKQAFGDTGRVQALDGV